MQARRRHARQRQMLEAGIDSESDDDAAGGEADDEIEREIWFLQLDQSALQVCSCLLLEWRLSNPDHNGPLCRQACTPTRLMGRGRRRSR